MVRDSFGDDLHAYFGVEPNSRAVLTSVLTSTRNPQPISAAKDRIGTPVAYTEGMAYKCFWHPQAPAIGIAEGI